MIDNGQVELQGDILTLKSKLFLKFIIKIKV